ncbi:CARDB domain-containing protein [Pontiella agarivorans]|uniref:CARDB domain-containing protein n=1 Tax=Pontiella agarivorans TaxID=3038953 RepID=A0ABU5N0U5_9BACT|nr:CARDB domain-containing protein [Pontiella agarivorans]MDZ8120033.1 CARDB domain-containing protein [Pontiella agarivorans]
MNKRISQAALIGLIACISQEGWAAKKIKGQAVERERPAEWKNLVYGGRFMDRFEPMPDLGGMTSDTWGEVVPRDINNGLEHADWSYWGGNTLKRGGQYQLMVCRWPENDPKGHFAYHESIIVRAVSDSPFGPFTAQEEIGPGHNPTWYQTRSGKYVLYHTEGAYFADQPEGPWVSSELTYDTRGRLKKISPNFLHNNTFAQREDGSFAMVNRHGYVWFSQDGISPYSLVTPAPVYPPVEGRYEDPVIWKTDVQYHLIVNDWYGRIAWYLRSPDGIRWKVEPGEAYQPGVAVHETGGKEEWFKYERIRVVQDEYGRAHAANFAVIDYDKHGDMGNDNHSSKLIVIPLTRGRRIEVLNAEKISASTPIIRLKIKAEDGFNPHNDMDMESLRFGASDEVNFGRGSKLIKTEKDGEDLILVFEGRGNGFTDENFAGKLLGKTKEGKLLFGWSRLPGIAYIQPILSARMPEFTKTQEGYNLSVEVQNFGQVVSENGRVEILVEGVRVGAAVVPPLKPFEKTIVRMNTGATQIQRGQQEVMVRTDSGNQQIETLKRTISIPSQAVSKKERK